MTIQRDLKTIIRARMERTGESYATARRYILAAKAADQAAPVVLPSATTQDEKFHPSIETTRAEAEAILKKALELEPRLTHFGLGIYGENKKRAEAFRRGQSVQDLDDKFVRERQELHEHLDEIAASADWIKRQTRIKTFNTHSTSYSYKHSVERWFSGRPGPYVYVANGSFIAAALGLGFPLKPSGPSSPNAYFQFSRRSVRTPNDSEMNGSLNIGFQAPASELAQAASEPGRRPLNKNQILLNLICAGVNDLVDRKLIDLDELEDLRGRLDTALFGKPARVLWRGIGFGELTITVWWNVKPGCGEENTERPLTKQINRAVDACCTAWLERKEGKWIQVHKDGRLPKVWAYLSRTAQNYLSQQPEVIPNGYSRAGKVMM
jgi:hypothetical protein